jgi:hypothetical protein
MSEAASVFLELLETEAIRLNGHWKAAPESRP